MKLNWLRGVVASYFVVPFVLDATPLTPMNVDFPSNVKLGDALSKDMLPPDYVPELRRKIKQVWAPRKGDETKKVVVAFRITRQGLLSNLTLVTSSGNTQADQAATLAVKQAAPFAPLPSAFEDLFVQFTFNGELWKEKEN